MEITSYSKALTTLRVCHLQSWIWEWQNPKPRNSKKEFSRMSSNTCSGWSGRLDGTQGAGRDCRSATCSNWAASSSSCANSASENNGRCATATCCSCGTRSTAAWPNEYRSLRRTPPCRRRQPAECVWLNCLQRRTRWCPVAVARAVWSTFTWNVWKCGF